MKIRYYGHSCFRLVSDNGTTVITDPYTNVGYELPKGLSADVVICSHGHFDHNFVQAVKAQKVISESGEYAVKDIRIIGEKCWHDCMQGRLRGDNILYKIIVDGITFCHFGDLGEPCSQSLLDKIGASDVWLIPVGGTYTIDALQAKEYVERLAPKLVIPMHYKPSDGALDIAAAENFLRLFENVKTNEGEAEIARQSLSGSRQILYMERIKA